MTDPARLPVALVFGAAVRPDGKPSPALRRRAMRAVRLWHEGLVGLILCSGGVVRHPPDEARLIAAICRKHGVPDAAILIEDRSTSTAANVRHARAMLAGLGDPPVVLVTDAWHLPRARLAARRLGLRVVGEAASDAPPRPLKRRMREAPALAWYWLTLRR